MRSIVVQICLLPVLGGVLAVSPAQAAQAAQAAPRSTCHGQVATIVGTSDEDRIDGTSGPDVIAAGPGDDRIDGGGGNDVICGEGGHDQIVGGRGDDLLDGGDADDQVWGSSGDDRLYGGRDSLAGSHFSTWVNGDVLIPGPGDDEIHPGFDPRQRQAGQWPDTIHFGGTRGVTVELADPGGWGRADGEGTDRILGQPIVGIDGTRHDDVLTGAASRDFLTGQGGADELLGASGDDVLRDGNHDRPDAVDVMDGGPGDDALQSDAGPDQLLGGEGDDELESVPGSCVTHDGGAGHDAVALDNGSGTLTFDAGASSGAAGQPLCGSTTAYEELDLAADDGSVSYRGTEGPDVVTASGAGPVTADLLGGDDSIVTGRFDDNVVHSGGHVLNVGQDDVIDAGDGVDTVDAGFGLDVCAHAERASNCESEATPAVLSCDGRVATIVADQTHATEPKSVIGTPGDDVILGSDGADLIDGGTGNDVICGRGGTDELTGGEGDDRLFGGPDGYKSEVEHLSVTGDTLIPGPGSDHLDAGWDKQQTSYLGGLNLDTVDYSGAPAGIDADLAAGVVSGQGSDTVIALPRQRIVATPHADRITGSAGSDEISAGGGADVIDAGAGDDLVYLDDRGPEVKDTATDSAIGGDGNDEVFTSGGGDTISTGAGEDSVHAGKAAGAVRIDTGPDDDIVSAHSGAILDGGDGRDEVTFTDKTVRGPVTVRAGAGTLVGGGHLALTLSGWEGYAFSTSGSLWRFYGTGRDEEFAAYGAARVLAFGRGGDDVLHGSDGSDRLFGGTGSDRATGEGGRDLCVGFEAARGCEVVRR